MHCICAGQIYHDEICNTRFTIVKIFTEENYVETKTQNGDVQTFSLSDLHEAIRDGLAVLDDSGADNADEEVTEDEQFLAGGFPLEAFARVYALGKRATVMVLLIHTARWIRNRQSDAWVTVPSREYQRFGIDSAAKAKTIAILERAGVVEVQRRGRQSLQLRLLPPPA